MTIDDTRSQIVDAKVEPWEGLLGPMWPKTPELNATTSIHVDVPAGCLKHMVHIGSFQSLTKTTEHFTSSMAWGCRHGICLFASTLG